MTEYKVWAQFPGQSSFKDFVDALSPAAAVQAIAMRNHRNDSPIRKQPKSIYDDPNVDTFRCGQDTYEVEAW